MRLLLLIPLVTGVGILSACTHFPSSGVDGDVTSVSTNQQATSQNGSDPRKAQPLLVDNLSAREHVQNAITLLQTGEEAKARAELDAALRQDPDSKIARNLMSQIDADPAKYFSGSDSFEYIVQAGDSLSTIAKKFLDDALKFHILAKYNAMVDPTHLNPGRIIKLPGKRPLEDSVKKPSIEPMSAGSEAKLITAAARRAFEDGKYQEVVGFLEGAGWQTPESRDLLGQSYAKIFEEALAKGNYIEALNVLDKALALQPNNEKLKKQVKILDGRRETARLFQIGVEALEAGNREKAYEMFTGALKLDPSHEPAKKHLATLKSDMVELLHKEAMTYYRKQNLDEAITTWDKVLALDPQHELAKLYRARALDLKGRLHELGSK